MDDFKEARKEGADWEQEKEKMEDQQPFEDEYTESHFQTERIRNAPADGEVYGESGEQETISSDGEHGRLKTHSHKELIRCDCGCVVDSILKTRRDSSGVILCEKHGLFYCPSCGNLIIPGQQVKVGDSYYHRVNCAERVIDSILVEAEDNPKALPAQMMGELIALKESLSEERWKRNMAAFKKRIAKLLGRNQNALSKRN